MRVITRQPHGRRFPALRLADTAWLIGLTLVLAGCGAGSPPAVTVSPGTSPVGTDAMTSSQAAPSLASPSPVLSSAPDMAATAPVPIAPTPGSAFTLLRMATSADPALPAPDARTFVSSFPPKAPALFVVFALRTGLTGTVLCTVEANGVRTAGPITLRYGPTNSWGDFKITSRGIFVVGRYRATIRFVPTGEVATIDFTVN